MKLIFAIVNNDDSNAVRKNLVKNGFRVTKLSSSGGFLSAGNSTFLLGVEDGLVNKAISLIAEKSHKRKEYTPTFPVGEPSFDTSFPLEVTVGGATIFVTDVNRFEQV